MHSIIRQKQAEIVSLCRRCRVRRLDLFGSAATGAFDTSHSDIDVLVEFVDSPDIDRFDAYFGLKEGLERLFGRPVDIVTAAGLHNPYFRASVMQTKKELYAA